MKKVLVIDNYDSFTFNLVHYIQSFDYDVTVFRNDSFDIEDVQHFDKIVLSPGPGIPDEAGLLKDVIRTYAAEKSILGICLGLQAIGEVFGGKLINLQKVYHGVSTKAKILIDDEILFEGLEKEFMVGRYHSWVIENNFPDSLEVTAVDDENQIMALRHKIYDVRAVQFHPESVLTPNGKMIIGNWLKS